MHQLANRSALCLAAALVVITNAGCREATSTPDVIDLDEREDSGATDFRNRVAKMEFPLGFRFGAACSAHQVEGNLHNNWTQWESLPQFAGHTVEPSGIAVDHYGRFVEDLDLAAGIGLDTFRFSIEWSRIEPQRGEYDEEELAHYDAVFQALEERGMTSSVTLHHFTEPAWFTDLSKLSVPVNDSFCQDGPSDTDFCFWSNPDAPAVFADFCGLVAQRYGKYTDEWMTINELTGYWLSAAVTGDFPPGLTSSTLEEAQAVGLPVLRGMLQAHADCYRAIHEHDTVDADGDGIAARVGLTTGTGMARPADPDNAKDVAAAHQAESLATYMAFDAVATGMLDADFDAVPEEHHLDWEGTLDILGLQYYASTMVVGVQVHPLLLGVPCTNVDDETLIAIQLAAGCPPPPTMDFPLGPEEPYKVYGRQHDPEGLLEVLELLDKRYPGIPIVITEHGFANYEHKRAAALVRHLAVCHQAVEQGIPLEGYYHWAILDNFEWGFGFAIRFGLFTVDYDNDLARTPTVAADVYKQITEVHGLSAEVLDQWGGSGPLPDGRQP